MTLLAVWIYAVSLVSTLPTLGDAPVASPSSAAEPGGIVVTLTARLVGRVEFLSGSIHVTENEGRTFTFPYAEVVRISTGRPSLRVRGPQAVRLRDGEIWHTAILELRGRDLSLRTSFFGRHTVSIDDVASMDFAPDAPRLLEEKTGWLYRESGEPTPCQILWLDGERLGVDSPLGVLTLKREDVSRYVFSSIGSERSGEVDAKTHEVDEVLLVDGSLLRGRLTIVDAGVALEHGVFGDLRLPCDSIREIARRDPRVTDLVETHPASLQRQPLTSGPVRETGLQRIREGARSTSQSWPRFVKALRIEAHTTVRYAGAGSTPRTLRTWLGPDAEARGEAVVRIGTRGLTMLERRIRPESPPERIDLTFQAEGEIHIDVDFGERIRFPCAILLADPLVIQASSTPEGEAR